MTIGAGTALIVSFFLHLENNQSFWAVEPHRGTVIFIALAAVAIALAIVTLITNAASMVAVQFALGFYFFGELFYPGQQSFSGLQVGYWMGAIGSAVMAVGGTFTIAALRSKR